MFASRPFHPCARLFLLVAFAVGMVASFATTIRPVAASTSTTLVISQAYGGGGSSDSSFNADFVEIFNLSQVPVSLNGKSIRY